MGECHYYGWANASRVDRRNFEDDNDEAEEDLFAMNNTWRCACEGGFLPPGFGGAEAIFRMGAGQCYHKQT